MITDADVKRIPGATVFGADGEKIGKAGAVYRDDESGRPDWMTVQTGLFGTSESFVPLADADLDGGDIRVPYDKARVKDAPRVDAAGHLDISEEDRLFEYYGLPGTGQQAAGQQAAGQQAEGQDRRDDTRDLDLHRDDAAARGRRDSDDSGLWRSSHDTHRPEHRADTPVDAPVDTRADTPVDARTDDRLNPVDPRGDSRDDLRDDSRKDFSGGADRGRMTEGSGLSTSPVSGTAAGAAAGQRKPRLSQWVLVERSAVIEVSEEDAQRLTGDTSPDR